MDTVHSQTQGWRRIPWIDPPEPAGDGRAMQTHYNILAGGEVGRIAALGDGIFAFAATLLVVDFHTPKASDTHSEAQLLSALGAKAPALAAQPHDARHLLARPADAARPVRPLEPRSHLAAFHFPRGRHRAAVLDPAARRFPDLPHRLSHLLVNILLLGACLYAAWSYAEWAKLIREEARGDISLAVKRRIVVAQSLYAIGALTGLLNVTLGITLILLIQLNYAIGPRLPVFSRL
jgi:uncharacterized membrane protein